MKPRDKHTQVSKSKHGRKMDKVRDDADESFETLSEKKKRIESELLALDIELAAVRAKAKQRREQEHDKSKSISSKVQPAAPKHQHQSTSEVSIPKDDRRKQKDLSSSSSKYSSEISARNSRNVSPSGTADVTNRKHKYASETIPKVDVRKHKDISSSKSFPEDSARNSRNVPHPKTAADTTNRKHRSTASKDIPEINRKKEKATSSKSSSEFFSKNSRNVSHSETVSEVDNRKRKNEYIPLEKKSEISRKKHKFESHSSEVSPRVSGSKFETDKIKQETVQPNHQSIKHSHKTKTLKDSHKKPKADIHIKEEPIDENLYRGNSMSHHSNSTSRRIKEEHPIKEEKLSPLNQQQPSSKQSRWGGSEEDSAKPEKSKNKPDFSVSGKLAEDTNTYKGVVIKYNEPSEARKPKKRWRLYPFKGDTDLPFIPIHRQSAYLIGRTRAIADIPIDHPSCSKQHAVLQYRMTPFKRADGTTGRRVRPYIIDLESANGTLVNNKKIDARCYVELMERDVVKFGFSSREYVLLHEESQNEKDDDDVQLQSD